MNIDKLKSLLNPFNYSINDFGQSFRRLSLKDNRVMEIALFVFSISVLTGISCLFYRCWRYRKDLAKMSSTDNKTQKVAPKSMVSQPEVTNNKSDQSRPPIKKTGSGKRVSFNLEDQGLSKENVSKNQTKENHQAIQNEVVQGAAGTVASRNQAISRQGSIRLETSIPIFYQSKVPDGFSNLLDALWLSCKDEFKLKLPRFQFIQISTSAKLQTLPYFYSFMFNEQEFQSLKIPLIIEKFQSLPKVSLNSSKIPFIIVSNNYSSLESNFDSDNTIFENIKQEFKKLKEQVEPELYIFIYKQNSVLTAQEQEFNQLSFKALMKLLSFKP